jgi:hypothetical protein
MITKTTEFFRNIKNLPPEGTQEFYDLIKWEEEKCLGGVTINGVNIPPWLYFHLNHWWIRIDKKDNFGNVVRVPSLPFLRDNEWIRGTLLDQCRREMKGYMEIGLRQGGKSEFEASVTGCNALLFKDTQNVIVGGNDPDLTLLKDKVDFGMKNMWKGLYIPRIDKNWAKSMVKLGYKKKDGDDDVWSYLIIRNADDGNNTETAAGTTAKTYVMDEVGKYLFGQVFEAAKPAFLSEFGWRTIPILVGTGGSFDNGADADRFFHSPDANNFLGVIDPKTGKKTCIFMSGLYRQDCKDEWTLSDFLKKEGVIDTNKSYSKLDKIPIKVSNKEKALEKILEEREKKSKDPDKQEYLKTIMYHPLTVEECFMTSRANIFNSAAAKAQKARLLGTGRTGSLVKLYHDGERITHEFTDKLPITNYPMAAGENKDAPVIIYEFPIQNPPYGLYVAGVDPYRQGKAAYSDSLGVVYIYKRMHEINSEKYQDMFVASYAARPDSQEDWNEQARLLCKYYNARILCENDELSFINYMIGKGDANLLEKQPDWLKEIVPHTTQNRDFGISRSAEKIRTFLHSCLKKYTEEVISKEVDENGTVIKEEIGIKRILDLLLLEEMIHFNDEGNFDRIVAAELAIAQALKMDPIIGKVQESRDSRYQNLGNRAKAKNKSKMFVGNTTASRKNKLFV